MGKCQKENCEYSKYTFKVYGDKRSFQELDVWARKIDAVWNYLIDVTEDIFALHYLPKTQGAPTPFNEKKIMIPRLYAKPEDRLVGRETMVAITSKNGNLSEFDMVYILAGAGEKVLLPSKVLEAIAQYLSVARSNKLKKLSKKECKRGNRLIEKRSKRFNRRWIPFKGPALRMDIQTGVALFNKSKFKIHLTREIDGTIQSGEWIKEADGWYICLSIKKPLNPRSSANSLLPAIGLDPGCKTTITCSDGRKFNIEPHRDQVFGHEDESDKLISVLQSKRDLNKARITGSGSKWRFLDSKMKKLETAAKRYRKHQHYNIAHAICDSASVVYCGDVSGKFLQKVAGKRTKQQALGGFREVLEQVCNKRGIPYHLVREAYTSMRCSCCGCEDGPHGHEGLDVREWGCPKCGARHDRDVNAAINIRNIGLLAENSAQKDN